MKRFFTIAAFALLLVACGKPPATTSDNMKKEYTFVSTMPSVQTQTEKYMNKKHDLSPLPRYRFRMVIPKDWETLDFAVKSEPGLGAFTEMGVFREKGDWMDNDKAEQLGEISVTTVNVKDDKRWASVWLDDIILKNAPKNEIIQKRTVKTPEGDAEDILFSYKNKNEIILTRMMAFRKGDRLYIVSGSDSINGYRDNAEAFYVAIATFALETDLKANPFLAPNN